MIDINDFNSYEHLDTFIQSYGCPYVDEDSLQRVVTISTTQISFYNNDKQLITSKGYKMMIRLNEKKIYVRCLYEDGKYSEEINCV